MAFTHVEVFGIGRDGERVLRQTEELCVHKDPFRCYGRQVKASPKGCQRPGCHKGPARTLICRREKGRCRVGWRGCWRGAFCLSWGRRRLVPADGDGGSHSLHRPNRYNRDRFIKGDTACRLIWLGARYGIACWDCRRATGITWWSGRPWNRCWRWALPRWAAIFPCFCTPRPSRSMRWPAPSASRAGDIPASSATPRRR